VRRRVRFELGRVLSYSKGTRRALTEIVKQRLIERLQSQRFDVNSLSRELLRNRPRKNSLLEVEVGDGELLGNAKRTRSKEKFSDASRRHKRDGEREETDDEVIDLVPQVPRSSEPLEMNDEDVGDLPDLELLRSRTMSFALHQNRNHKKKAISVRSFSTSCDDRPKRVALQSKRKRQESRRTHVRTIPQIILPQSLLLRKLLQTILDADHGLLPLVGLQLRLHRRIHKTLVPRREGSAPVVTKDRLCLVLPPDANDSLPRLNEQRKLLLLPVPTSVVRERRGRESGVGREVVLV